MRVCRARDIARHATPLHYFGRNCGTYSASHVFFGAGGRPCLIHTLIRRESEHAHCAPPCMCALHVRHVYTRCSVCTHLCCAQVSKETYVYGKRGRFIWQKRPMYMAEETYVSGKRDLCIRQKRPIGISISVQIHAAASVLTFGDATPRPLDSADTDAAIKRCTPRPSHTCLLLCRLRGFPTSHVWIKIARGGGWRE